MNKLLFLLFIFALTVISCDGRNRKYKTSVEVLKENKLLDSFSEQIKFTPEAYAEVLTDTILSNGYRIKIKTFSDMSKSFLNEYEVSTIRHKHYFRKFISQVYIEKDNVVIFNTILDNAFFEKKSVSNTINFENYILTPLEVDQIKSIEDNKIVLIASMTTPEMDDSALYNIIIDYDGNCELKKIDYART